jgi:hypothetical protein
VIATGPDAAEIHAAALATVKVYVATGRSVTVVVDVVPLVTTLSGRRVNVHVPVVGRPVRITVPFVPVQVTPVIGPIVGAAGMAFTASEYAATAAEHGTPRGLFVVTVIITVLSISPAAGVYVNENGETDIVD